MTTTAGLGVPAVGVEEDAAFADFADSAEGRTASAEALGAQFQATFLWGAATSAYQVEGAVRDDGRGESIWDRFSHTPGRIADGSTGDVACDHYHRWRDDLDLIARLGLRAYRFSIAWPRILPDGRGRPVAAGLGFYRRLVEGLLDRGVTPVVTLYHWDLPQALQDRGGWTNRDTAQRFAEYVDVVARELGDLVPTWVTHNEPWVAAFLGNTLDLHAPGGTDLKRGFVVAHHLLVSHGMAIQALRASACADARMGVSLDLYPIEPRTDRTEDVEAARLMDGWRNRWLLDPLLRGHYPDDVLAAYTERFGQPDWIQAGDPDLIARPIDLLGVNFYSRWVVEAGGESDFLQVRQVPPRPPLTAMGWEVAPAALTELLIRLHAAHPAIPLYITENGAAYDDVLEGDEVHDPERLDYLRRHIAAVARARAAGVDVRGYFAWSLMDNFEWSEGYRRRFGLVRVDFETQQRRPRTSAGWYRDLIAASVGPGIGDAQRPAK